MDLMEHEARHFQQLRQLLPPGPAFDLDLQPDIGQLLAALAPELARVDQNNEALLLELNPATATVLLPVWEDYLGLPDGCTVPGSQTIDQRRLAVIAKLTATGAPQLSYYLKLGPQVGLPMVIDEFLPARVGAVSVGDLLYGDGWPWSWVAGVPVDVFGTDEAATLACRLQREAPEYTDVVLGYGKEVLSDVVSKVDQLFTAINYVTPAAIAGGEDL